MKGFLLAVFVIFLSNTAWADDPSFRHIGVGDPYLQFCGPQLSGPQLCSKQLNGKTVVFTFFRIDQKLSQDNMVRLQELYNEYRKRNVAIVGIASGAVDRQKLQRFLDGNAIDFPVILDGNRRLYSLFGVYAYPSTGVFAPDKTMRYFVASKWINFKQSIEAHIRQLLGEITDGELADILQPETDIGEDPQRQKAIRNYNLARVLFETGDTTKAKEILAISLATSADYAPAHVLSGQIAIQRQDFSSALSDFDKALVLDPSLIAAQQGRQLCLDRLARKTP